MMQDHHTSQERSTISLPSSKGALSPAQVKSDNVAPRDYFSLDVDSQRAPNQHRLSRVSEMLHRSVDSTILSLPIIQGNGSQAHNGSSFRINSPFSSTDSLASLVERQHQMKINHPHHQHQLFANDACSSTSSSSKRQSIFISTLQRATSSLVTSTDSSRSKLNIPTTKSPLNYELNENQNTRRLKTNIVNPHHVHSTPNVKDTKKVSLEYNPVSRKQVLNTYEIVRELGRGEHGKVKLAKDLDTDELVAIKIVDRKNQAKVARLSKFAQKNNQEEKIRKEIAIMKKLNHPNIVQLKEVLDDCNSRKIYLVLEYLEKGEIKWQEGDGVPAMSLPVAIKMFRDVVLGLEYLHYQGIIHRDIKPANLLISKDNSVKISDFGVSYISSNLENGDHEETDLELAKTAGTPAFFAPELCQPLFDHESPPKITYKIDIWALGITLYCFIFGKMPFWGQNEFELFKVINEEKLKFPSTYPTNYEWNDEEKFEVKNLLFKILEKDPTKRITIADIKKHPLVLRGLSVRECLEFMSEQNCCIQNKIDVSNKEMENAVSGIGHKLKKHLSKALQFAGFKTTPSSPRPRTSASDTSLSTYSSDQPQSIFYSTLDDPRTSPTSPAARSTIRTSAASIARAASVNTAEYQHSRNKSQDGAIETKTTVEGDLFLNTSSHALSSLNHLMFDDMRKASSSGLAPCETNVGSSRSTIPSSGAESIVESSADSSGNNLVSLPINASFASLDSVYLDNYAPAYSNSNFNSKFSDSGINTTNSIPDISIIEDEDNESADIPVDAQDMFKKMSNFSLNKDTDKKDHDYVAPDHDVVSRLPFSVDSTNADNHFNCGNGSPFNQLHEDNIIRPRPNESTISIPAHFIDAMPKRTVRTPLRSNPSFNKHIKPEPKKGDKPKYSFFENSDSEENSEDEEDRYETYSYNYEDNNDIEIEFANSSDEECEEDTLDFSTASTRRVLNDSCSSTTGSTSVNPLTPAHLQTKAVAIPPRVIPTPPNAVEEAECQQKSSEDESADSEEEDLFVDFNRNRPGRPRTNTISINPSETRPQTSPHSTLINNHPALFHTNRISSPLSKNAPSTPVSNDNAHLYDQLLKRPHASTDNSNPSFTPTGAPVIPDVSYNNHYQRIHRLNSPVLNQNDDGENTERVRSNSITVGILQDKYNAGRY